MPAQRSLYIHFPFCSKRCNYCDFVTFAGMNEWIPLYMDALRTEALKLAELDHRDSEIHTIFLGGGTPSLIDPDQLYTLLYSIRANFSVKADAEISMEVNPGTVTREKMSAYRQAGVNRVSLGVQSFLNEELRVLGRIHTQLEAYRAIDSIRQSEIANLNLDLIYGLPGQTLDDWEVSISALMEIKPEHISLYCLTIENGTPLALAVKSGKYEPIDDDLAAIMYERAIEKLSSSYEHYEISNWARIDDGLPDHMCRHNLQYWQNNEYIGMGTGAHGYYQGVRYENPKNIQEYLLKIRDPEKIIFTGTRVDDAEKARDEMMLGLRLLLKGVRRDVFRNKFGKDFNTEFAEKIDRLIRSGLVEWIDEDHSALILTKRGMMLGNRVFMEFAGTD